MQKFIVVALLFSSCAPQLYVPNTRNTPLFRQQGEFQGTVSLTTGLEGQLAYAPGKHLAIITNGSFLKYHESAQDYNRKHRYLEGGIGYYNATRNYRIEIFAGYGFGQGTSYAANYYFTPYFGQKDLVATGKYNRFFLQPTFGTNNPGFNLAFTLRASFVNFISFSSNDNNPAFDVVTIQPDEGPQFFLEPAATGKFPITGNLQGLVQLGLNVAVPNDAYFDYVPIQFAIGIQLNTASLRSRVY